MEFLTIVLLEDYKPKMIPASGELYGRAIEEWVGRTQDTPVPDHVQLRVLLRQNRKCAITGRLKGKDEIFECDHIIRLKDGGLNVESNLQMILVDAHKIKSAKERKAGKKVSKLQMKSLGISKQTISQRKAFQSKFKRKISGEVVLR